MLSCHVVVSGCHSDIAAVTNTEMRLCRSSFKGLQSLNQDVGGVKVY